MTLRRAIAVMAGAAACCATLSSPALAAHGEGGPTLAWLKPTMSTTPSNFAPGSSENTILVSGANLGTATLEASAGNPVKIVDRLPSGWSAHTASAIKWPKANTLHSSPCTLSPDHGTVTCTFTEPLAPYERWEVSMGPVTVPSAPADNTNTIEILEGPEGKEVVKEHVTRAVHISSEPTPFGVETYEITPENEEGGVETRAGAHPFQLTTQLNLNTVFAVFQGTEKPTTPSPVKNLKISLPPGLVGNVRSLPQCTEAEFATILTNGITNECPASTDIGAAVATVDVVNLQGPESVSVPVVNLVPAKGEPARFGFTADGVPVTLDTSVQGGDFRVTVSVANATLTYPVLSSVVTIWGNPGDVRHDPSRGFSCLARGWAIAGSGEPPGCKPIKESERTSQAFLSMPSWCSGAPLESSVEAQSWKPGAGYLPPLAAVWPAELNKGLTECDKLPFHPELSVTPLVKTASTPTGLKVLLTVPQESTLDETGPATADLRNTEVVLPNGVKLNPSAANGLQACNEKEIGFKGFNPQSQTIEFNPEVAREESAAEEAVREANEEICPKAAKVGVVRIKTPILERELHGSVYIAKQDENPFGSLFALYVVVKDPQTGIVVKLAGRVDLNGTTGQITSTFDNAPQDPFQEFELEMFGGPRASVTTPRDCGSYTTQASLQSWASATPTASLGPEGGLTFGIEGGTEGLPCMEIWPFKPAVQAGTTSNQAGGLTGFNLTLSRPEGNQAPTGITLTMPPGLAGYLKNVTQCPEPQANEGTCGPESLIGEATAVTGLGSNPYTVKGGRVYITGPYTNPKTGHTSPFGLSVVIPAVAGPFDFGNVVTRSSIDVNENTTQLTIGSELPTMVEAKPAGGGPVRQIGAPVQLRQVQVSVNRPNFQFNPTNCTPMSITGSVSGEQGSSAPISQPYQVQGCENLPFAPKLTVETDSRYTRTEGTSLKVIVEARPGEANIKKTKLVFPLQLPSRLTTLQKACIAATFEANPASCPPGSVIGRGTAHTPVLNSVLTGPVYLVSHGGAAFPDAEFVLQGEGITVVLDGKTNIHNGVTSSTFETVPDAPVERFEVMLPKQTNSAFTGYEDLCKPVKTVTKKVVVTKKVGKRTVKVRKSVSVKVAEELVLPTIIGGQNGDVIEETTPLKVANCAAVASSKVKKAPAKKKKKSKKKKKRK